MIFRHILHYIECKPHTSKIFYLSCTFSLKYTFQVYRNLKNDLVTPLLKQHIYNKFYDLYSKNIIVEDTYILVKKLITSNCCVKLTEEFSNVPRL